MNEEIEKAMDALAGGSATAGNSGGVDVTDWKAKYEEAQRELNSARVDQGRVKKLDEENKALRSRLAGAEALKRAREEVAGLDDETRGNVPDDYLVGAGVLAQKMAADAIAAKSAEFDRRMAEREQRDAAASRQRFGQRVEQEFPGFFRDAVSEGGDKHEAWVKYQRYNAPSINAAVNAGDFDTLAWHIRKFYTNELGLQPPSGASEAAAPEPSAISGGQPATARSGKTYTWDEIDKLYDEIEVLRSRGDKEGMKRLSDEVEMAQKEGRVK